MLPSGGQLEVERGPRVRSKYSARNSAFLFVLDPHNNIISIKAHPYLFNDGDIMSGTQKRGLVLW